MTNEANITGVGVIRSHVRVGHLRQWDIEVDRRNRSTWNGLH